MELDDILLLYEENKIKDFESHSGLTGLEKANVVNRVNKRLRVAIENDSVNSGVQAKEFVNKQLKKLDVKKNKKSKSNKTGMFKYDWAEDIYKENAFLGAEINKMKEHSRFNKMLIQKIKNYEKMGKKPNDDEVEKTIQSLLSNMDKENLNESEIIRRKSIDQILSAVIASDTETMEFTHDDEESGESEQRTLIFLKLEASKLSFSEVRSLKKLFDFEEDPTSNMLMIEGGIVKTVEADPALTFYEDVARTNIIEVIVDNLHNDGFVYQKSDAESFIKKAKDNAEETRKELQREFTKKKNKESDMPFYNKPYFINIIIGIISLSIVGILAYKTLNYLEYI
jgi:hypothetical protein